MNDRCKTTRRATLTTQVPFSPRTRSLALGAAIALGAAAFVPACVASPEAEGSSGQAVIDSPVNAKSTAWWWYYGQSAAQVSSLLSSNDARLVSLRVESTSPLLFDVALVQNTGSYAKGWWWYYGETAQSLGSLASANNARIVSIEPYVVNGQTLFAAIMIANTGADASAWWWYYGQSPSQIGTLLQQNDARLIDLREYGSGVYGVVMIANTGANQTRSWWYYGVSAAQVSSYLTSNDAFLVSLDPGSAAGTFNVVMNANPGGFGWWWYYGQTASEVGSLVSQNDARLYDLKSYVSGGSRYFDVLMISNGTSAAPPPPPPPPPPACSEACTSAGGGCNSAGVCEKGCENSPLSCTATVSDAFNGFGFIGISCMGTGNGVYTVSLTSAPPVQTGLGEEPPGGPWIPYSNYSAGAEQWVFQGATVAPGPVDEDDIYLPGCDNGENPSACQIHATYVQVCAQPGAGQFTEQSGLCGNLESFPQQCVTAPVTYP